MSKRPENGDIQRLSDTFWSIILHQDLLGGLGVRRSLFRKSISAANEKSIPDDDFEYAARCAHWLTRSKDRPKNDRQRRRDRLPVILTGNGIGLRIDRGTLHIRNGFTHFPQQREEFRYFRGDLNLPSRILLLDGSGSITFDVLEWLGEQRIPLIQMNWRGDIVAVAAENGYSADAKMVRLQIAAQGKEIAAEIARWLISEKFRNSIRSLRKFAPDSAAKHQAISHIEKQVELVSPQRRISPEFLLGIEGRSAALYFQAFHGLQIRWKSIGRKPIPADWHKIGSRLSPLTLKNQNARHPINAMLNYAYTVLNGQVRIQIVAAGLDASIGMMHQLVSKQRDNLVLDLVEPLRPVVDQFIFGLALDEPLSPSDFTIMANGACRLNPQMARTIATGVGALLRSNPIRADLSPDAAVTVGAKVRGQSRSGYVQID